MAPLFGCSRSAVPRRTRTPRFAVLSAFGTGWIYVGGEITAARDLLEAAVRAALAANTLNEAGRRIAAIVYPRSPEYRLPGAVAIVAARTFAVPRVARCRGRMLHDAPSRAITHHAARGTRARG